jgi:hypothetical protein
MMGRTIGKNEGKIQRRSWKRKEDGGRREELENK